MLMHLAQLQVDYVNISTNCIYFNNGNQFEIHKHKTNEMHQIQDIFMWTTDTIQHCPKYKLVRINADWYKNEKYNKELRRIYERLQLSPKLEKYAENLPTVVHMRLENDWVHIARMCNRKPKHCWWPREVYVKVQDLNAHVVIAQKNTDPLILEEIRRLFVLAKNYPELSYTENTAVHMLIAANANRFWGNSFSTFSRGVAQIRQSHNKTSFAYDCAKTDLPQNSLHLKSHGVNAFTFEC